MITKSRADAANTPRRGIERSVPMHDDSTPSVLHVLRQHVIDTRAAYYRGVPGITYEDMAAAARRYLTMMALANQAAGRPTQPVTTGSVARLLRGL